MRVISSEQATAVDQGQWTEYDGSKLLISHMSKLSFQRKLNRLNQPYRKKIENGTVDPEVTKRTTCRAMAGELLMNWDDTVLDSEGKPIPFSEDAAFDALMNDPNLREFVSDFAQNFDNYRREELQDLGKV